ncbi:methyl-accepting chemotaxis protein [Asticcacaulis sp. MM231]|uniref:methyl-accepting chemotaxis protein n=1 Tax=Asticcacaulis sp. MM231 TaxID=3157666 RepID=UPI0032D5B03E
MASEVKQLAGQTSRATTDISEKIALIQEATTRAVNAIQGISDTIADINNTSSIIASAVDQQGAATREIVQAVSQASIGTAEVTSNITGVAHAAEQTGDAASQVLNASGELAGQAERLHQEMDKFLTTVRAA